MATKRIEWNDGSGDYITLTYQGQGSGPISIQSDENNGAARSQVITLETTAGSPVVTKNLTIRQAACPFPIGEVRNYAYTGSYQEVTLPAGNYKLQCWGAQGGNITGSYTATGSKGGYSEGVLTITSPTVVRIFVGGKGANVSTNDSAAAQNGGWNGGGGTYKKGTYSSGTKSARCYVAPGGGASDICLVSSSMSYSGLRNNRSAASLLSRFLVAGGGGGAAVEIVDEQKTDIPVSGTKYTGQFVLDGGNLDSHSSMNYYEYNIENTSKTYKVKGFGVPSSGWSGFHLVIYYSGSTILGYELLSQTTVATYSSTYYTLNLPSGCNKVVINTHNNYTPTMVYEVEVPYIDTTVYQSSGISYGGGVESGGSAPQYKAYQDASEYTEFGLGKNQTGTGIIGGGGAGAGWYGGATNNAYDFNNLTDVSGGGSGFVNTAANASHRPSGYTGLQLDSGETKAGNTTFKAPGGSNETGHSGDGYIRITRIS